MFHLIYRISATTTSTFKKDITEKDASIKMNLFYRFVLDFSWSVTHTRTSTRCFRVSRRFRKNNAVTLHDLEQQIQTAYNPTPVVQILKYMLDVKNWMSGHIDPFKGHSFQHQFKLEKTTKGIEYRKWSTTKMWLPDTDNGEEPLLLLKSIPSGLPLPIPLQLDNVMNNLTKDIRKYGSLFDSNQTVWWKDYLEELKKRQACAPGGPFLLK